MDHIAHIPAPPLNAYIHDLYYIDGQSPYPRLKVSPDPMLHLMVNLGQPFEVYAPNQATPFATCSESWWIGLWSHYWIVDWPQPVQFYGVHFKPAGVYPFLRLPLSELHNQVVPVDAIWGQFAAEIREQLYGVPTPQAGLVLLEQLLLERLAQAPYGLDIVQCAIGQIARQHGALSIRALSDHMTPQSRSIGDGSRANPTSMTYRISIRILWNLPDTVRPTTCVCAAASLLSTPSMPWMLAPCQLIEFLQVIRVTLLHDEK